MSQPALPNRHLFPSSRTQLIVTAEKLSLFQIYKAQKRGGGCGGNSTAQRDLLLARGAVLRLLSPAQHSGTALPLGTGSRCHRELCHPRYPTHTALGKGCNDQKHKPASPRNLWVYSQVKPSKGTEAKAAGKFHLSLGKEQQSQGWEQSNG